MKYIRVDGEFAYVELTRGQFAKIDASDVCVVQAHSWHAVPHNMGGFYARSSSGGYMHRLITDCPFGKEVDHDNHDTLDNTRDNLIVGTHADNMQNGKFALATHCPQGHPYDERNTYRDKRGRRCKKCNAERVAKIYAAETPEQTAARRAQTKRYREANKVEIAKKRLAYAMAHKAEKAEYDRRRFQARKAL